MRRFLPLTTALLIALLAPVPPALAAWTWPLQGELITGYRNGDDPYAAGQHRGIDIAGAVGTPVVAAAAGEVRFAGVAGSSGLTVSVRTDDGFDASYLHLGAAHVRAGERVAAGQRLGVVGTSGVRSAQAPHLHFGVREAGSRHAYRDPLELLPPQSAPAPDAPAASPQPEPVPAAPVTSPEPLRAPNPTGRRVPRARPAPVRRPVPAPLPRRGPARRTVPQPSPVPLTTPEPAARPVVTRQPRALPAGRPARAPAGDGSRARDALERPALGASPSATPEAPPTRDLGPAPSAPPARPSARSGPDLGLALACLGVLLAAAIVGFGGNGRGASRRGGARHAAGRIATALRPLVGRR
jgi:outer membrane biosynthesis protein TonB